MSIDKNYCNDFNWHKSILDSFILNNSVLHASVRPDDLTYLEESLRHYQYVFGWITYFANDLEILIPNDLKGVEYNYTDKGKYLILTHEDFTSDKETYEAHKKKSCEHNGRGQARGSEIFKMKKRNDVRRSLKMSTELKLFFLAG